MKNWISRWIASALALFIIAQLHIGIVVHNNNIVTLLMAVVAIGLANAFIRPLIMLFAWPINCLTFGLFSFVLNAALFWFVGSGIIPGFEVKGFVPALIGSLAMGFISGLINYALSD